MPTPRLRVINTFTDHLIPALTPPPSPSSLQSVMEGGNYISNLPVELLQKIVDHLAHANDKSKTLIACSLVCRAFVPLCRIHLFRTAQVGANTSPSRPSLARFLNRIPTIGCYIQRLKIPITPTNLDILSIKVVQDAFKHLTHVQWLSIFGKGASWPLIQEAFHHIFSLPSLTQLQMVGIVEINFMDFLSSVSLTKLILKNCQFNHESQNYNPPTSLPSPFTPIPLKRLEGDTSADICEGLWVRKSGQLEDMPIFNLETLTLLSLAIDEPGLQPLNDCSSRSSMLGSCKRLNRLNLYLKGVNATFVGLAELIRPLQTSLEYLELAGQIDDSIDPTIDPMLQLVPELEQMRKENILRSIQIELDLRVDCAYSDDRWNVQLDKVLTKSDSWPHLTQLSLCFIKHTTFYFGNHPPAVDQAVIDHVKGLPFERLAASPTLTFCLEGHFERGEYEGNEANEEDD